MALIWVYALNLVFFFHLVEVKNSDSITRDEDGAPRDARAMHMFKLYEKVHKERRSRGDDNTVRSFQAIPVSSNNKVLFHFNLTSMPESELILSASLHFFRPHGGPGLLSCRRFRGPSCHGKRLHPSMRVKLIFKGMNQNTTFPLHLGNITQPPLRKEPWQMSDVTSVLQWARARDEHVISAEFEFGDRRHQDRLTPQVLPYILIFAKDLAIDEPNSIAMSLQRYNPVGEDAGTGAPFVASGSRIKREAKSVQNVLPSARFDDDDDDDKKHKELWYNTYFAFKPKTLVKNPGGRRVSDGGSRTQELNFDKRTMKKARRKQWSEPRACARRYLRVDFADIGWSEWILAPKAFEAYYCSGTCGFPMPEMVHPSNHGTIQSIVKAVGIVPGVPDPCCVPEKMSELAVLYLDSGRNMVLKLYPNMSVETCACR